MKIKLGNAVFEINSFEDINLFKKYIGDKPAAKSITLGLKRGRGRAFTKQELDYMKANFGRIHFSEMADALHRSRSSVRSAIQLMKEKGELIPLQAGRYRILSGVAAVSDPPKKRKAFNKFTLADDIKIIKLAKKGIKPYQIGKRMERSTSGIIYRLQKLKAVMAEQNAVEVSRPEPVKQPEPQPVPVKVKPVKVKTITYDTLKYREGVNQPLNDLVFACAKSKSSISISDLVQILGITVSEAQAALIEIFNSQNIVADILKIPVKMRWKVDKIDFVK